MDDGVTDNNAERTAGAGPATYEVGYGKPPRHSRFKPGQSGNPKGRKRGSKSTGTLLREILDEKVVVREGNREKKLTRKEAWLRQTMNGSQGRRQGCCDHDRPVEGCRPDRAGAGKPE